MLTQVVFSLHNVDVVQALKGMNDDGDDIAETPGS